MAWIFYSFFLKLYNMKNIATGLIWFTAGAVITAFFTKGKGQNLIEQLASIPADAPITENDLKEAVNRVEKKFRTTNSHI